MYRVRNYLVDTTNSTLNYGYTMQSNPINPARAPLPGTKHTKNIEILRPGKIHTHQISRRI